MLRDIKVSFEYVDFHTKMSLILDAAFGNQTTKLTLMIRVLKEIQQSLSQEEQMKCKGLPIILGLYSDGFSLENPL